MFIIVDYVFSYIRSKSGQAYIEELLKKEETESKSGPKSNVDMIKERLESLKSLFDDDLITETEYQ